MFSRVLFGLTLLQCACANGTSSSSLITAPQAARVPISAPDPEHELYEIILQLARDPSAQAKLAPAAHVVFHGEDTTDEPLKDAYQELSWIRESNPQLLTGSAPEPDSADEAEAFVRLVPA